MCAVELTFFLLCTGVSLADELNQKAFLNPDNYDETKILSSTQSDEFCQNATIKRSLLIQPADKIPRATIGCNKTHDQQVSINVTKDLTLINTDVRNIYFKLTGDLNLTLTLTLVDCVMTNTRIGHNSDNGQISLQIVNTTFRGHLLNCTEELDCGSSSQIRINSTNLTLWYLNSTFFQTQQYFQTVSADKVSDLWGVPSVVTLG